ncbi:MAG: glycosyltransferase family 4 protein, partial [Steroidobacteraceae bacterium]
MTRVGIVAVSKPIFGGTFQYTVSMIEALQHLRENRYTLYTERGNDAYDSFDLPVSRLPSRTAGVLRLLDRAVRGTSSAGLFRDVDKVIAPIYSIHLLASARPFAFTLHDLQEKYYPQHFTRAQRAWRHASGTALSRAATRIVCESQYVKNDIRRFYRVPDDKVVVIPAPPVSALVHAQASPAALAEVYRKLSLPEQYLFYPAQFWAHKNHARLLDAFAAVVRRFPQCHLVLTGRERDQFSSVMAHAARLGLRSRLRHLGHLDENELAAVYRRAALLVIPTLFESISIPVYEAFLLGVPVCA